MKQIEYINNGDEKRTVRVIEEDGTVLEYELFYDIPEHRELMEQMDANASLRPTIEETYVQPANIG